MVPCRYSWCRSFGSTLRELNDYASHREALAQNLHAYIVSELVRYTQDLKTERKSVRHAHMGLRAWVCSYTGLMGVPFSSMK